MTKFFRTLFKFLPPLLQTLGAPPRCRLLVYSDAQYSQRGRKGLGVVVTDTLTLGESQAATDPVLGPKHLDAEAKLQATKFEDRLQASAVRRDSITIAPATSEGIRSGHNRYAPEPDNNFVGQSARAGDNNLSRNVEHHYRLSGLGWNLGPHGFEKSGLHIDRIFSENRSVICLQDLRISLRRKEEIRSDLERRFPYKVFISVYQHRATQRHRNTGYVFSTLTALHTGVFLSAFSFQLGAPE
jgi:hypothetical protein